jgi:hypothetical protein
MKRIVLVLIALIFVLASYCPAPAASAKGSDEAEIKALEQRIADAANAKDPDAIMKNYFGAKAFSSSTSYRRDSTSVPTLSIKTGKDFSAASTGLSLSRTAT